MEKYTVHASDSPQFFLAQIIYEGVNDLVQNHMLPHDGLEFPVHDHGGFIWAESADEKDVIGILSYEKHEVTATVNVTLLYVEQSSRRQGVATAMLAKLTSLLENQRYDRVTTSVDATNTVAMKLLHKRGYVPGVVQYEFEMP